VVVRVSHKVHQFAVLVYYCTIYLYIMTCLAKYLERQNLRSYHMTLRTLDKNFRMVKGDNKVSLYTIKHFLIASCHIKVNTI